MDACLSTSAKLCILQERTMPFVRYLLSIIKAHVRVALLIDIELDAESGVTDSAALAAR